ncbi:hypothetical protein PA598K_05157 [Paenibacillus sp. 598K]|nr:hypothetical protein PA598K_05157 [Paenibacillus sp. 598K]
MIFEALYRLKAKSIARDTNGLYVHAPLTEQGAVDYLLASTQNEVWTPNEKDAKALAMRIGQGRFRGPENHYRTGFNDTRYFYHYHGGDDRTFYQTGHIFYGTSSHLGLNKR